MPVVAAVGDRASPAEWWPVSGGAPEIGGTPTGTGVWLPYPDPQQSLLPSLEFDPVFEEKLLCRFLYTNELYSNKAHICEKWLSDACLPFD